jgi:hypothetical protein
MRQAPDPSFNRLAHLSVQNACQLLNLHFNARTQGRVSQRSNFSGSFQSGKTPAMSITRLDKAHLSSALPLSSH